MGWPLTFTLTILTALIATLYQAEVHRSILLLTGIAHDLRPLSDFPYQCRRIEHPHLQACEDMWFSETTRQLFLACSDPMKRKDWFPLMNNFNLSARPLNDAIMVVDIDELGGNGEIPAAGTVRQLTTLGFAGVPGDEGRLYALSLSGVDGEDGSVRLWVVNQAPAVDVAGQMVDQSINGANVTVEVFEVEGKKAAEMKHVQTFVDAHIATPNRVAPVGDGTNDFWYTNDHGLHKVGLKWELGAPLGWGDVSFCSSTDSASSPACRTVSTGHKYPNGLAFNHHDGKVYVPSSLLGRVYVYNPTIKVDPAVGGAKKGDLELIETLDLGYALDNIIPDANGDLFIAGLSKAKHLLDSYTDPMNNFPATTAFRVRDRKGAALEREADEQAGYEILKIIEDAKGGVAEVLPAATSVLHDAKTGRVFFASVISPFIGVCEYDAEHPNKRLLY